MIRRRRWHFPLPMVPQPPTAERLHREVHRAVVDRRIAQYPCYGDFGDWDLRRRRDRGHLERPRHEGGADHSEGDLAGRARKLDLLNRATRLDALRVPPGNRLEALQGTGLGSTASA